MPKLDSSEVYIVKFGRVKKKLITVVRIELLTSVLLAQCPNHYSIWKAVSHGTPIDIEHNFLVSPDPH